MKDIWNGYLKVDYLSVPVKVCKSTSAKSLRFDALHKLCRTKLHQKSVCPHCNRSVTKSETVIGYPYSKNSYVILTEADFCRAQKEPAGTIDVHGFVDDAAVDSVLYRDSYYLVPADTSAREGFVILRDALALSKKLAIAKVVVENREQLYAVKPYHGILIAFALHYYEDVMDVHKIHNVRRVAALRADSKELSLARELIDQHTIRFTPAQYRDDYAESLRELIKAKAKGKEFSVEQHAAPAEITNVTDALEKSLKRLPVKGKRSETQRP